jgi:hypothetical protein
LNVRRNALGPTLSIMALSAFTRSIHSCPKSREPRALMVDLERPDARTPLTPNTLQRETAPTASCAGGLGQRAGVPPLRQPRARSSHASQRTVLGLRELWALEAPAASAWYALQKSWSAFGTFSPSNLRETAEALLKQTEGAMAKLTQTHGRAHRPFPTGLLKDSSSAW